MRAVKPIAFAAAALLILAATPSEARHGRGGGHHGGRRAGGHSGTHHHHLRQRHQQSGFYGFAFSTTYLGHHGRYQPYRYRGQVYRHPRSSDVALNLAVQNALTRDGYYRGAIDGVIGRGSRSAIRAFQHHRGLPPTGWIDGQLLRKLRLI